MMKTVSSAHFGWSRLKVKAISSASRAEAVVFAAKIDGIQRGSTIGFADPASGSAPRDEAAAQIGTGVSGGLPTGFSKTCAELAFEFRPTKPIGVRTELSAISGIKGILCP